MNTQLMSVPFHGDTIELKSWREEQLIIDDGLWWVIDDQGSVVLTFNDYAFCERQLDRQVDLAVVQDISFERDGRFTAFDVFHQLPLID